MQVKQRAEKRGRGDRLRDGSQRIGRLGQGCVGADARRWHGRTGGPKGSIHVLFII